MALRIWLPLNGNLENKGTMGFINFINSGATIDNNGKIGKCYSFNGSNNYLSTNYGFYTNNSQYSVSAWIYSESASATQTIICDRTAVGSGFSIFLINGKLKIDPGGNGLQWTTNYTYPINTWFHLTVTYYTSTISYYINGEFKESKDNQSVNSSYWGTVTSIGASQANGSNYSNYLKGKLNDIRFYDHCLSPLEVKEVSQGLMLHYKLDSITGDNLLLSNPKSYNSAAYNAYQLQMTENLQEGQTYTIQLWDVEVSHSAKTAAQTGVAVYWGGGSISLKNWAGTSYIKNNHADYLTHTFTVTSAQASGSGSTNAWLNLYNSVSNADGTRMMKIGAWKLEKGSIATPWTPAASEAGGTKQIIDSSGYGYNLNAVGSPTITTDTERYNQSIYTSNGSYFINSVSCRECMPTDSLTVNIWIKPTTWSNPISCTEGGGWNFESSPVRFPVYVSGVGYKIATSAVTGASLVGDWHMLTGTFDKTNVKIYIDGELQATTATDSTNGIGYANNGLVIGGEANNSTTSAASSGYVGNIGDVRIYATALNANDIMTLYNTSAQIDNCCRMHAFSFKEGNDIIKIYKNGIVDAGLYYAWNYKNTVSRYLYDSNLYIEPDGAVFFHIYHHKNPAAGSFAKTNSWGQTVYLDENRWFDGTSWVGTRTNCEFMIKYAFTEEGIEYKERWVQKNPNNSTFEDVDAADIIRNTSSEYKQGTWGGLYKSDGSAHWIMNNGHNGNWWGATGSFSIYQGGIPGYGGTITTSGYNDLYIRIDNLSSSGNTLKFSKNNFIEIQLYNGLIEK